MPPSPLGTQHRMAKAEMLFNHTYHTFVPLQTIPFTSSKLKESSLSHLVLSNSFLNTYLNSVSASILWKDKWNLWHFFSSYVQLKFISTAHSLISTLTYLAIAIDMLIYSPYTMSFLRSFLLPQPLTLDMTLNSIVTFHNLVWKFSIAFITSPLSILSCSCILLLPPIIPIHITIDQPRHT